MISVDPRIGTVMLGYEIESVLGAGGMGVVYRARDRALGRTVALKVISPLLADQTSFRERFLIESRVAASFEHPNAVPIYEAGEHEGLLYIAMRYVDGHDLKQLLRDGILDPADAVDVCDQVANALDAAHDQGLVHRDVKPSNIMVDNAGRAYLVDFGLSRSASVPTGPPPGSSLGTVDYVAPEQIRGDAVDGRADVYSLACVLYECLAGHPPFRHRSDAAVLFAHLEQPPPELPPVDRVIARGLAKLPDERYQTCGELIADARIALGLDRRPRRFALLAGIAAVAVLATVAAIILTTGSSDAAAPAGTLLRLDPATGDTDRVALDAAPIAVTVGGGRVWVATGGDERVLMVDPRTLSDISISVPHQPASVAYRDETTFALTDERVAMIDRRSATVAGQRDTVGGDPYAIAAGPAGVWAAVDDWLVAVRRTGEYTGHVGPRVEIHSRSDEEHARGGFNGIAVGDRRVWAVGDVGDPELWTLDTATLRVVRQDIGVIAPGGVAAGYGSVWVTDQIANTIVRVDAVTGRVIARIPVGHEPLGVAAGDGNVWVTNAADDTVSEIDPTTNQVVTTLDVGDHPTQVAVGDGSVWIGEAPAP